MICFRKEGEPMKKTRKSGAGMTKAIDFLIRIRCKGIIKLALFVVLALVSWQNSYILFAVFHALLMLLTIPAVCEYTASTDMNFTKLKKENRPAGALLRRIKIPRFMRKYYYGCSYDGEFLWISFAFQTILYLYTAASLVLYGTLIIKLILESPITETARACCRFMLVFLVLFVIVSRLTCLCTDAFLMRRDGRNKEAKEYLFGSKIPSLKEDIEIKKAIATVNHHVDIINGLKKSGLREYKKGYCVKKSDLTEFENAIRAEYPDLEYSISRRSQQIYITVREKGDIGILFRAAVKNSTK